MSDNFNSNSQVINSLRRMTAQYDAAGQGMNDFTQRQMQGEHPDPEAFMKLLEQRATTKDAMQAQFKLYEKPMKTVLNETK